MSQTRWLVAGIVPGVERQPLKKLAIDEHALPKLLNRWRAEAEKKGHQDRSARHGASQAGLSQLAARRARALQNGRGADACRGGRQGPSRERETLVGEASRIITRVKAAFVRLGIRSSNPKLKAAAARLEALRRRLT
jgi:transposase